MSIPLRLLLVQDHHGDVETILNQLRLVGFEPTWQHVETEADFVAHLDARLDLILADFISPQFHPLRALRLLRERDLDIPLIVVTRRTPDESAVECMRQGAADYVLKYRLDRLGESVNRALEQKYLRMDRPHIQTASGRGQALNQAVLNSLPANVAVLDRDGTIVAINEAWSQFATDNGASSAVRTGIGVNYLDVCWRAALAGDDSAARVLAEIQAVLDGSQAHFTLEYPCHSPAEQRWFEMSVAALLDKAGGVVIVHTDITERKQAQESLTKAELLRAEIAREREIIDTKQRFVLMATHDLRSPLTAIMVAYNILTRYFDRLTAEERLQHLRSIEAQVKHMGDLLDDVLTLGKAQIGKLAFNPYPLDLESLCREVFQQMQLTDTVGHQFIFVTEADFGHVPMDEKIVRHILVNLLSNAIKYSPDNSEIRMELSQDAHEVILRISDQGIGIPEENQAEVFEPFHRAQNARAIEGTGLGLAIVKSNVEAHGGTITLESMQHKGTTFTVRLPMRT